MNYSILEEINKTEFKFTGEDSLYAGEWDIDVLTTQYESMIKPLNLLNDAVAQAVLYTAIYLTTTKRFDVEKIEVIQPTRETTPTAIITYDLIDALEEKFQKARNQYQLNETRLIIDSSFLEDKFEYCELNEMMENDQFPTIDYEKVIQHFNLQGIECVVSHNGNETTIKVKKW